MTFRRPLEPTAPFRTAATRSHGMTLDLAALAAALDGTRPLATGTAHLGNGTLRPAPARVPASAFVTLAKPAPETAVPESRPRPTLSVVARNPGLPRRHKVMLAAAAAVMALGLLRAGTHGGTVVSSAPAALPADG